MFTLSAANGTFSVDPSVSNLGYYFQKMSSMDGSYAQITVPASQVNTALEGIIYTPDADFYGHDAITVTVDDLGNRWV